MWSIVSISRRVRETRATHERVLILHFIVSVFMQAIACLFRFPQRHHRPRSTQYTVCRSFLLATPARIALFSLPFFPRRQRRCDFSGRVSFFLPGRVHRANRTVHGVFPFFPSPFDLLRSLIAFYLFVCQWIVLLHQSVQFHRLEWSFLHFLFFFFILRSRLLFS